MNDTSDLERDRYKAYIRLSLEDEKRTFEENLELVDELHPLGDYRPGEQYCTECQRAFRNWQNKAEHDWRIHQR